MRPTYQKPSEVTAKREVKKWLALADRIVNAPVMKAIPLVTSKEALAADLQKAASIYRMILKPSLSGATSRDANQLLSQANSGAQRLLKTMMEIEDDATVSHLLSVDASFLKRLRNDLSVMVRETGTAASALETGRASTRPGKAAFPDVHSPEDWLIGDRLPQIYNAHFGRAVAINTIVTKEGETKRAGPGLSFLRTSLDGIGVSSRNGKPYSDEMIRDFVRRKRIGGKS